MSNLVNILALSSDDIFCEELSRSLQDIGLSFAQKTSFDPLNDANIYILDLDSTSINPDVFAQIPTTLIVVGEKSSPIASVNLPKNNIEKIAKYCEHFYNLFLNSDFQLQLDRVCKNIYDPSYIASENGIILCANKAFSDVSGYPLEEIIGKDSKGFIPTSPNGAQTSFETFSQLHAKNGKTISIELFKHKINFKDAYRHICFFHTRDSDEKKENLLLADERNVFLKQLNTIRNDLDHVFCDDIFFEVYYKPKDILSGDSYGAILLKGGEYLLYIVNSVGSSLSSSVSSIQASSFILHAITKAQEYNDFNFLRLVENYQNYIKARLLDEEIISTCFVYVNQDEDILDIVNFGGADILAYKTTAQTVNIECNNDPIMNFSKDFSVDNRRFSDYEKILIKSSGFDECMLKDSSATYTQKAKQDFHETFLLKDFIRKFKKQTLHKDVDLSAIMLAKIPSKEPICTKILQSNPEIIDDFLDDLGINIAKKRNICTRKLLEIKFTLNEILLNSIEHGNLEISYNEKQKLVLKENLGDLIKHLLKDERFLTRKVTVSFYFTNYQEFELLCFDITDEGDGFDVSGFFKSIDFNKETLLHGRGILMSNHLCEGVFYNKKGNRVKIFIKMEDEYEALNKQ